jgi:hypothetical protein
MKKHFVNYSTNGSEYEWGCFNRVFILRDFMKEYNFDAVFHLDSDCILLESVPSDIHPIAYCVQPNYTEYHMCSSIHAALLNIEFCDAFEKLYRDIYENKTRFHLIDQKIQYHKKHNIPGGICDMTLYYLLSSELKVDNLMRRGFMNNINSSEGPDGSKQYEMNGQIMKIYDDWKIHDLISDTYVKLKCIHLQGGAKNLIMSLKDYLKR